MAVDAKFENRQLEAARQAAVSHGPHVNARDSWEMFIHQGSAEPRPTPSVAERTIFPGFTEAQQDLADRGIIVQGIRKETRAILLTTEGDMVASEVIPIGIRGTDGTRHTMRVPTDLGFIGRGAQEKPWKI